MRRNSETFLVSGPFCAPLFSRPRSPNIINYLRCFVDSAHGGGIIGISACCLRSLDNLIRSPRQVSCPSVLEVLDPISLLRQCPDPQLLRSDAVRLQAPS